MTRFVLIGLTVFGSCVSSITLASERTLLGAPMETLPELTELSAGSAPAPTLARDLTKAASMASDAYERLIAISSAPEAHLRGPKEIQLYSRISPSVVLIVTPEGIGSGSIVGNGEILTNWHVVQGHTEVVVIYKPSVEGTQPSPIDARRGKVVRVDGVGDLALVEVVDKKAGIAAIDLGSMDAAAVGADVHAIGHPTGEAWTYTKGVVSQIRHSHVWSTSMGVRHQADVIQTQTPINPGNSGGPLLDDEGKLLGVNSFKAPDSEGLNFAVDVDEVRRFLATKESRLPETMQRKAEESCEPKTLASDRISNPAASRYFLDLDCDGRQDAIAIEPDSKSLPIHILVDSNGDGRIDGVLEDADRDGKVDTSLWDEDWDGQPDLKGYHTDGNPVPSRLEPLPG